MAHRARLAAVGVTGAVLLGIGGVVPATGAEDPNTDSDRTITFEGRTPVAEASKALSSADASEIVVEVQGTEGPVTVGVVIEEATDLRTTLVDEVHASLVDLEETGVEVPDTAPTTAEMVLVSAEIPAGASAGALPGLEGAEVTIPTTEPIGAGTDPMTLAAASCSGNFL